MGHERNFAGLTNRFRFVISGFFVQGECQLGLADNGEGTFFLGTLLFNSATVIYDMDNNQVGFVGLEW